MYSPFTCCLFKYHPTYLSNFSQHVESNEKMNWCKFVDLLNFAAIPFAFWQQFSREVDSDESSLSVLQTVLDNFNCGIDKELFLYG